MAKTGINLTSCINVTVDYDTSGKPVNYNYEWVGPKDGIVGITLELLEKADPSLLRQEGDTIFIGSYCLRVIEENDWCVYAVALELESDAKAVAIADAEIVAMRS